MQGFPLKIFPLLIVVALLSMGVRVSEMLTGTSHAPGVAMAESEEKPDQEDLAMAEKSADEKAAAENPAAGDEKMSSPEEMAKEDAANKDDPLGPITTGESLSKDEIIWRDASDSDTDMSSVKMEVYEDLVKRRASLEEQKRALATREALMQAAEQELERKYQELENIRSEMMSLLNRQSEEEEQAITSMVKIYEGMKPKEAAPIFDKLPLDILVAVAGKMSERKLSSVLAAMDPERARTLTIMMVEQKTLPTLPVSN